MATVDEFREAFQPLADPGEFPDPQVTYWMGLATKLHNADRWGDLLDHGIYLFTAHHLILDRAAMLDQENGQAPGQVTGLITSASVDKVSYSRDASSLTDQTAGHWNATMYGLQWVRLSRMVGAGPMYVGADMLGSFQGAWPGVIPPIHG